MAHTQWGPGRLLYPRSHRVAGKDPGSRRPPARRATLPATRHAATGAPTGAARTASRESEASHDRQATEDSIARAHSLGLSGGSDPDPASFSHQAPAMGLQWTGIGDPHQRGTPLRPRPTAALQKQVSIRALNKDHNHDLTGPFKPAATRASVQPGPFQDF